MDQLADKLEQIAHEMGARFFGVADLESAPHALPEVTRTELSAYPRAVSVGLPLLESIVDQLSHHRLPFVALTYRHHYETVNARLDQIALRLAGHLQRESHRAWPVPASQTLDEEINVGAMPHKLAAHLAGLGWIGKSCLLVTPECGPRVRWVTVLTEAPLAPTGGPQEPQCGECRLCVDRCPAGAFTGRSFRPDEPREVRYDARACRRYHRKIAAEHAGRTIKPLCGVCVSVCPFGRPRTARQPRPEH